jgi:ankyrin repeat protein
MPWSPIQAISFTSPSPFPDSAAIQTRRLSIPEQCEQRLNAVLGPDLPGHLSQNSGNDAERLRMAVESFKQSPAFANFKNTLLDDLQYFHCLDTAQNRISFEQSDWGRFAGRLELIPIHANDSPFRTETYQLYYQSCPSLQRMRVMLNLADEFSTHFPPGTKQELIQHLAQLRPALSVCDPGVIQNIASTFHTMKNLLLPPNLERLYSETRVQIARNYFQELVRKTWSQDALFAGNEIHMVAAFQNHFATKFDFPVIDDIYASTEYVRQVGVPDFELNFGIRKALAPDNVCLTMAREILDKLRGELSQQEGPGFNAAAFNQALTDRLDILSSSIGIVFPHLVCSVDENLIPTRISYSPNLLALELFSRVPALTRCGRSYFDIPILDAESKLLSLKVSDVLVWVEEKVGHQTEKRLLDLHDLTPANIQRIFQTPHIYTTVLLQIAHEALRNSNLPDMKFFREVPYDALPEELHQPAVWAAFTSLAKADNKHQNLATYFQHKLRAFQCGKLLLSSAAGLLSQAQLELLRNKIVPEQCMVHSSLRNRTFQQFVLNLNNHPELGLYKATPWLFKSVLDTADLSTLPINSVRTIWATEADPAYLNVARKRPELKTVLSPAHLIPSLIEQQNRHNPKAFPALVRAVAEITAESSSTARDFSNLMLHMLDSSIPDLNCASLLLSLLDKQTEQQHANMSDIAMEESLLCWALHKLKPRCAMMILHHPSTHLPENTHARIWKLFGTMQNGIRDFQIVNEVLEALVNQGVRLNMPEQFNSALIELCDTASPTLIRRLINLGCDPALVDSGGNNALFIALEKGAAPEQITELLKVGVPLKNNPAGQATINLALELNQLELASLFHQHMGGVNVLDQDGYAPLHKAIIEGGSAQDPVKKTIELRRIEALLKAGRNPNLRTSASHMLKTPLHLAYKHWPETVTLLLTYKADPNQLDAKLRPPRKMAPVNR